MITELTIATLFCLDVYYEEANVMILVSLLFQQAH
jgi:hypothetical protein